MSHSATSGGGTNGAALTGATLREAAGGALALQLPAAFLAEQLVLPLRVGEDGRVVVAAGRPVDPTVTDELVRRLGHAVVIVDAPTEELQAALLGASRSDIVTDETLPSDEAASASIAGLGDLRAQANDAPVVQLVNAALSDALKSRASDVHLESTRSGLRLRHRLDGVLRDVATYPAALQGGAISRIKLLAGLDIAERRLPQDGRARVRLGAREVDLRVSTLPALHGESIVIRILDHGDSGAPHSRVWRFSDLGMPPNVEATFDPIVKRASGLVLVTGPTGSGKTTTLYSALALRNDPAVKIVTVEDPVEYQVPGVTQVPVNRKAGLDFANVLRSILRHDPDIVMVGELRDRETAEMAVQSALTGHLVFGTLHTNDAPGAVTRLIDMGVEPYLVAATVQGVLAQRLVRVTCTSCAVPIAHDDPALSTIGGPAFRNLATSQARRGTGCARCDGTGYRGRTAIYELYVPDDRDRRHLSTRRSLDGSRPDGASYCLTTLADAAASLVFNGVTTPEEVQRVLGLEERVAQPPDGRRASPTRGNPRP